MSNPAMVHFSHILFGAARAMCDGESLDVFAAIDRGIGAIDPADYVAHADAIVAIAMDCAAKHADRLCAGDLVRIAHDYRVRAIRG